MGTHADRLRAQLARLEGEVARAEAREALSEELSSYDWAEGDVLYFQIRFPTTRKDPYAYVALFTGDRWWVTGTTAPSGVSIERLVEWFLNQGEIVGTWQATEWEEL
jgi:hypothetical protein